MSTGLDIGQYLYLVCVIGFSFLIKKFSNMTNI